MSVDDVTPDLDPSRTLAISGGRGGSCWLKDNGTPCCFLYEDMIVI